MLLVVWLACLGLVYKVWSGLCVLGLRVVWCFGRIVSGWLVCLCRLVRLCGWYFVLVFGLGLGLAVLGCCWIVLDLCEWVVFSIFAV